MVKRAGGLGIYKAQQRRDGAARHLPSLADGSAYLVDQRVQHLERGNRGKIAWVTWDDTAKRWVAVVAWDGRDEWNPNNPPSRVPLNALVAERA